MSLPKYEDCEFSLFVSYAHDDNITQNGWIENLKNAIQFRLRDFKDQTIPKKQIHFSSQNGPTHGSLGFELEERVKKSFAMLLVVGDHYVDSGWKIAISPTTQELEESTRILVESLSKAGAECHPIDKAVFECYEADDSNSVKALQNELSQATHLVVPFQDTAPLYGGVMPGGHIGILEKEWLAIKKQNHIVWFKPCNLLAPDTPPKVKHLEVFRKLSPLCPTPEAVVSEIFGRRKPITICVERNDNDTLYEAMQQNIHDAWINIISQQATTLIPPLKFRPLYLDDFDKSAAGFVLVFPCGTKGPKELRDAILSIEDTLEEKSENYGVNYLIQGRVAVVLARDGDDKEAEKAPKDLWPTFKCRQVTNDRPPELDLSLGKESLEAFLNVLLKQHKKTELSKLHA